MRCSRWGVGSEAVGVEEESGMTGRRGGGAWSSGRRRIGPASGSMERVGEDDGEGGRRRREEDEDGPATGRLRAAWGAGGRWGSFPRSDLDLGGGGRASGGASGESGVADRLGFRSGWGLRGGRLGRPGGLVACWAVAQWARVVCVSFLLFFIYLLFCFILVTFYLSFCKIYT